MKYYITAAVIVALVLSLTAYAASSWTVREYQVKQFDQQQFWPEQVEEYLDEQGPYGWQYKDIVNYGPNYSQYMVIMERERP